MRTEQDAELVTTTTVTWRWKEGNTGFNATAAAPYIGHLIQYSKYRVVWLNSSHIPFQASDDLWQEGTVTGLEPDTQYWFDILIYRVYSDGALYVSPYTASRVTVVPFLTAKTLPDSSITRK